MNSKYLVAILAVAGLSMQDVARSAECPIPACNPLQYLVEYKSGVRCPNMACLPHYEPPTVEFGPSDCYYDGWSGYNCEVWPRGTDISYTYWASSGIVSDAGPTTSPYVWVGCRAWASGETLSVSATSPFGLSSSASISLPCQNQQEY
jgi:hypothetical protein